MPNNTMAKRYQRSNQNVRQYNGQKIPKKLSECQTIQWPNDTKEVIRMPQNTMAKRKRTKGQTVIYKTKHYTIKLQIVQHEPHYKQGVDSCTPDM